MILVGLTGWGDHDRLHAGKIAPREKLKQYSSYFPVVEVDASFYAIQPVKNAIKWADETPDGFQFIVKAYQGMTGHQRGELPFQNHRDMFQAFKESLKPYLEAKKHAMTLFQFPPWFDCKRENVDYLRSCRNEMGDIDCALEFRHQSWFKEGMREKTIEFMKEEQWIHSICDEPQAGMGSIPAVIQTTSTEKVLIRFHGRNVHGWNRNGSGQNWREVRYLYRYNEVELKEWVQHIKQLDQETSNVYVLFNNNSGGDAAENAQQMMELLNIEYRGLHPRQLDLF